MTFNDYAKACMAKGGSMSFEDYSKACKAAGSESMSAEDYGKAEQDYLKAEKSEIDANDLLKAIGDFETVTTALTTSGGSRESILTDKFKDGTISKSESQELGRLMAGETDTGDLLNKSLTDRIEDADPDASGLIDASDFLKSLVHETNEALSDIGAVVERDGRTTRTLLAGQGALLKATAQVLSGQNNLLKSQQVVINEMGRRLGVLEGEPVVRKSQGVDPRDTRPRQPGQGGGRGASPDALNKSQVQQGLRGLMVKAAAANDDASIDKLSHATALYESTGQVHPNIAGAIRMELGL